MAAESRQNHNARRRRRAASLVKSHLGSIKRALLEGEKRPVVLEFLRQEDEHRGIYALYDKKGRLQYVGKASDLRRRLDQHLKDRHAQSWDQMTLFFLADSANVGELEGLIVATAKPPANKQKPRVGTDKRRELQRYLKDDAIEQIKQAVYPNGREKDRLSGRITPQKLKNVTQMQLAKALGISQGRVWQLIQQEPKKYAVLRNYIRDAGRRDSILLLLQKSRVDAG